MGQTASSGSHDKVEEMGKRATFERDHQGSLVNFREPIEAVELHAFGDASGRGVCVLPCMLLLDRPLELVKGSSLRNPG